MNRTVPDKSLRFHMWYSRKLLMRMGFVVDELEISKAASAEIADKLERSDSIYAAGGNMFFLLQEMNRSG